MICQIIRSLEDHFYDISDIFGLFVRVLGKAPADTMK